MFGGFLCPQGLIQGKNESFLTLCKSRGKQNRYLPVVSLISKLFERPCRLGSKLEVYLIMRNCVIVRVRFLTRKLHISISKNTRCVIAVAFHSGMDALNATLHAHRLFQNEAWTPAPIKVWMEIRTGALTSTPSTSRHLTETNQLLRQARFLEAGKYLCPRGRACLSQLLNGKGRGQIAHKRRLG